MGFCFTAVLDIHEVMNIKQFIFTASCTFVLRLPKTFKYK